MGAGISMDPRAGRTTVHRAVKVAGGKMLVVDGILDAGRLASLTISGDFFCFPETAMDGVSRSLEGVSVGRKKTLLWELVRQAIPSDAELVGVSIEAIVDVVIDLWRDVDGGGSRGDA